MPIINFNETVSLSPKLPITDPPVSTAFPSTVSATHGQPQSGNSKFPQPSPSSAPDIQPQLPSGLTCQDQPPHTGVSLSNCPRIPLGISRDSLSGTQTLHSRLCKSSEAVAPAGHPPASPPARLCSALCIPPPPPPPPPSHLMSYDSSSHCLSVGYPCLPGPLSTRSCTYSTPAGFYLRAKPLLTEETSNVNATLILAPKSSRLIDEKSDK